MTAVHNNTHTDHNTEDQPLLPVTNSLQPTLQPQNTHDNDDLQHSENNNGFGVLWHHGTACIVVSACFFSAASALVRPLDPAIPVFQIVVVRSLISLMLSGFLYKRSGATHPFYGKLKNTPALVMRGLCGASAMDCFYAGLKRLPLGESVALMYINPAITAIAAWLFLKEALGLKTLAGCLASFVGVLLVARPPFIFGVDQSNNNSNLESFNPTNSSTSIFITNDTDSNIAAAALEEEASHQRAVGVVFAVMSAVLASGAYLTIRLIGKKEASLTVAIWFHTSAFVSSIVPLCLGYPNPAVFPSLKDWICLIGIACSSFFANLLLSRGFQLEPAAKASAINYLQVINAHILGLVFFGETPTLLSIIGAAAIACGILAVTSSNSSESKTLKRSTVEERKASYDVSGFSRGGGGHSEETADVGERKEIAMHQR